MSLQSETRFQEEAKQTLLENTVALNVLTGSLSYDTAIKALPEEYKKDFPAAIERYKRSHPQYASVKIAGLDS